MILHDSSHLFTAVPAGWHDGTVETSLSLPPIGILAATYALEAIKGFGPQKFRELRDQGLTAPQVLAEPSRLPTAGKRGDLFRSEIARIGEKEMSEFYDRASRQLERAHQNRSHILLYGDEGYPKNLWQSNNPVPVLFVRGNLEILRNTKVVACVGSRGIEGQYKDRQHDFAMFAAKAGWVVASGFAMGADSVAHRGAYEARGATVCVMPSGLDRPFPPENKSLWAEFIEYPRAVMVSEFPFGTPAASLTLRKRNKTIVGLARGVLIGQSSYKGGAMNAYRFAREQRKPTASFKPDGREGTSGNQAIIEDGGGREFAVDHPDERAWGAWLDELSYLT
ncbi:DNA-processing protein DprA [Kribbella sp. CA-294648]|uniref:DNA-processing protein DprA n=1 Tax=Kribbella sp. CA-294648 TaxID=3239948 RepID=UPI003D8B8FF5